MAAGDDYMLAYLNALHALEDEADDLRDEAQDESLEEADRAEAGAARLDLEDRIAHLKDAHEAFMRAFLGPGVPPPDKATIARAQSLSAAVAAQIRRRMTASALLAIVTTFVNDWAQLSGAAPAAAAGGQAATANNLAFLGRHGTRR